LSTERRRQQIRASAARLRQKMRRLGFVYRSFWLKEQNDNKIKGFAEAHEISITDVLNHAIEGLENEKP